MSVQLSCRADLYRAALHFVAKGQEARSRPELAGVRVERSGAGGVILIGMSQDGFLALRDPDGFCSEDVTLLLGNSFFDAARRAQRETSANRNGATLDIERGEARLSPNGAGVAQSVGCCLLPFPEWRRAVPNRISTSKQAPPIPPPALQRLDNAALILAHANPDAAVGVLVAAGEDKPDIVVSFDGWPDVFAVIAPMRSDTRTIPWRAPIWMIGEHAQPHARAS